MYIHELKKWPEFRWDHTKINEMLPPLRYKQGCLIGGMEAIGFALQSEAMLQILTQDVVKSSEIEGEILDQSLVRSSVARHLGMDIGALDGIDRNVEGVVEMVLDATQHFDKPLTKKRLFAWHTSLFPNGQIKVGAWRKGHVEVVSGPLGRETIHFEGPLAKNVNREMSIFLEWLNSDAEIDPLIKVAIAHLWFVTIHPFEDGNGRIGRAIADLLLARCENSSHRFYSLSAQIQRERKKYYAILEETQKGSLNITDWIEWFLSCLERAIDVAHVTYTMVLQKAHFWEKIDETALNMRQRKVLNRLLEGFKGKLTTSKWAKLTKCSQDTAYRDILDLIDRGILKKNEEGGRSTSYSLIVE